MYSGMYEKNKKGVYMKFVVVAIISFAVGALIVGGQRGEVPSADTDSIKIGYPINAYIDSAANNIYYDLTGDYFTDINNVYDRCVIATYNIANLEVNRITCFIEISYINSTIFIVGINGSGSGYNEITRFQNNGTVTERQMQIPTTCDIAVIVFYYGLRQVIVESVFDYK
jgi:hypothetical protein